MVVTCIDLAPDNGLQPVFLGRQVELEGSEKIAVVRDGDSRHAEVLGLGTKVLEPYRPVQKAIFRVAMKMNKI